MSVREFNYRVGGLCRPLGDGREIHFVRQMFNYRVSIGPAGGNEFDDQW